MQISTDGQVGSVWLRRMNCIGGVGRAGAVHPKDAPRSPYLVHSNRGTSFAGSNGAAESVMDVLDVAAPNRIACPLASPFFTAPMSPQSTSQLSYSLCVERRSASGTSFRRNICHSGTSWALLSREGSIGAYLRHHQRPPGTPTQ